MLFITTWLCCRMPFAGVYDDDSIQHIIQVFVFVVLIVYVLTYNLLYICLYVYSDEYYMVH